MPGVELVAISDTHSRHGRIEIPPCDVLVHAGDVTRRGRMAELEAFLEWFSTRPARTKVFIAGNHDACCERQPEAVRARARAFGVVYLQDESLTIDGVRIHGSPVTPTFRNMAFNRDPGPAIREHWDAIPDGIDLLVTHGPPHGVLDRMFLGMRVGCTDLLERVRRVRPRVHVFGHIHEAHGETRLPGLDTRFINAASARLLPRMTRPVKQFRL
jgi:Icc-related predicted phosphoesterase